MRIALLNLPVDNNYGGNLQRYALMKVLQEMGHEVTHLNLRFNYNPAPLYVQCYRILRRIASRVLKRSRCEIIPEIRRQQTYKRICAVTDVFYNKYVKHTKPIYSKKALQKLQNYDVYMVGSDQVWRKSFAWCYDISTYFFDYLSIENDSLRIAYGVSLGTDIEEYNEKDLRILTPLFNKFKAVSVRERSALTLFKQYGWDVPTATLVLDPTLLLTKQNYIELIESTKTELSGGNLFCYILDMDEEKQTLIKKVEQEKGLTAFVTSLKKQSSVEQWLRSFLDADYIITDSYHGLLFSTIFNKPFHLFYNPLRGNSRFDSVLQSLYSNTSIENPDWNIVNDNLLKWRQKSISYLYESLKE